MPVFNGVVVIGGWMTMTAYWEPNVTHIIPISDRREHELNTERACPCRPETVPSYYDGIAGRWEKRVRHTAYDGRGREWWPRAPNTPDP